MARPIQLRHLRSKLTKHQLRYQNFIWILQLYNGTLSKQAPVPAASELNTMMQLAPSTLVLIIGVCRSSFDFRASEPYQEFREGWGHFVLGCKLRGLEKVLMH